MYIHYYFSSFFFFLNMWLCKGGTVLYMVVYVSVYISGCLFTLSTFVCKHCIPDCYCSLSDHATTQVTCLIWMSERLGLMIFIGMKPESQKIISETYHSLSHSSIDPHTSLQSITASSSCSLFPVFPGRLNFTQGTKHYRFV